MVRVAVVQTDPVFGAVPANLAQALQLLKLKSANLYVLPELFNTGYNIRSKAEIRRLAEQRGKGTTYEGISAFAREKSVYITYGFAERDGMKLYNSAALVGPRGLIGVYRKTHLFGRENLFFTKGNTGFSVYRLPIGRVGLMICFDWYFPEATRTLALKGAQLIAHPSNLVLPNCPEGMKTRCLENRVFAATANRVGHERRGGESYRYIGQSQIVSPRGQLLFRLSGNRAQIRSAKLDLSLADSKKLNRFNHLLKDRRPIYYGS